MAAARALAYNTCIGVLLNSILQHIGNALLCRNIDVLTGIMQVAIEQGSSGSKGCMYSGVMLRELPPTHGGRFVDRPSNTHQATHSILDNITGLIVCIRSGLPKTGDRAHHQAWIYL